VEKLFQLKIIDSFDYNLGGDIKTCVMLII